MFRRIALSAVSATVALSFGGAIVVNAASDPNGTGQPTQSCGSAGATSMPNGFNTTGFNDATLVYAATSDAHSAVADNSQTVSQYDVACYQITQSGH